MKSLIKFLSIFALSLSLAACGGDNKKSSANNRAEIESLTQDLEGLTGDLNRLAGESLTFNGDSFDLSRLDSLTDSQLVQEKSTLMELQRTFDLSVSKINQMIENSEWKKAKQDFSFEEQEQLDGLVDYLNSLDLDPQFNALYARIDELLK